MMPGGQVPLAGRNTAVVEGQDVKDKCDLYIIGRFCLSVCNVFVYLWFQVGFHGFSWFWVGFSCFQVGFSWFFIVPGWFFMVLGRFSCFFVVPG